MGKHRKTYLVPLALALCLPAQADERAINLDLYQTSLLQASGHPNELARWHGIWNFDNGRMDEARAYFERAASYGDKLSQHFLTLMYWNGEGVERDPAVAYVWADLAAERANNHDMLEMRERIWGELTEQQRRRALEIGPGYYAKYGDAAAQPRNDAAIRRFMRTQTGTRVGLLTSKLDVSAGRPDLWAGGGTSSFGPVKSTGTEFYADSRTRPGAYWKAEDVSLKALLKQVGAGRVDVGEVKKVEAPATTGDQGK
ncbi:sel1 repeat family protein [Lysobacter niastensis]|uniref:Sel1 repeat family protein n=1 Tax=Lysobacter niastensis TaxID=380629 RepID=A0ABS0BAN5_9GAMM|nr:sel1 repeat family protein [Lysobacter niastensis]MBF6026049.1 sel1 repeat family protein [Lysobacter niastensis]